MFWYDSLFLFSGITGAALLFIAALSMIFIPKKINDFYGYRTKRSMRSQDAWDIPQRYANRLMIWVPFSV